MCGGRCRQERQRLCLQPRQAPDVRVRPRRQPAAHLGRGRVSAPARRVHGARRHDLADRRRRPFGAPVHARRQGAADHRRARQARALHERRAVSPLHPHRDVARGRHLCVRRLRQFARPQILPDGSLQMSWGEPGTDPGQFNIAHNISCDPEGWVYVADRENHRVQVFDGNGKYGPSGTICTGPAGCSCRRENARSSASANSARCRRSIATCRISVRASASSMIPASASRGLAGWGRGWPDRVPRAARARGRQPRRHLCRRGVLDRLAADLPRPATAGQPAVAAQVPPGGVARDRRFTSRRAFTITSWRAEAGTAHHRHGGRRPAIHDFW